MIRENFTLKATSRLKSRKLIQQLFIKGKSLQDFPMRVIFMETDNQSQHLQAAFAVSKKYFKRAVERNRIRRLMRECYRLQKNNLQNQLEENGKSLAVFFLFTGKELPDYKLIYTKTGSLLLKLESIF